MTAFVRVAVQLTATATEVRFPLPELPEAAQRVAVPEVDDGEHVGGEPAPEDSNLVSIVGVMSSLHHTHPRHLPRPSAAPHAAAAAAAAAAGPAAQLPSAARLRAGVGLAARGSLRSQASTDIAGFPTVPRAPTADDILLPMVGLWNACS